MDKRMQKITMKIDGMMCGMCESHICDAIRNAAPVKKATASHTKGEAVVIADESVTDEMLRAAVEKTGYDVLAIEREPYEKKGLCASLKH